VLQTSTSLALRSILKSAVARSGLDRIAPRLTGVTPAALALHVAAVSQDAPLFLVVAGDRDVEEITSDARFFLASLEGLGARDVETLVLPFPSQEVDPFRGLLPHLEVASARARALQALAARTARLIIASARALQPRLSPPDRLRDASLTVEPGTEIAPQDLGARLAIAGFTPEDPVDEHGEFCVRGGIVDFYPSAEDQPVRLEFIGDVVESVRRYDAATQRSLKALDRAAVIPQRELLPIDDRADGDELDRSATILDYVRAAGASVLVFELEDVVDRGRKQNEQWRGSAADMEARGRRVAPFESLAWPWQDIDPWLAASRRASQLAIEEPGVESVHVSCRPVVEQHGRITAWIDEVRRARDRNELVLFVAASPGRAERTIEMLREYEVSAREVGLDDDLAAAAVLVSTGRLSRGFQLPEAAVQFYAETDLFEEERRVHERRRSAARSFMSDFRDLKVGDLVVHVDSGIGRFVGLRKLSLGHGQPEQEFMELRYADEDKLFVPLERLDLVQKYTGGAGAALDKLGGTSWEKAKSRVRKAMRDMAEELLKLYAARKAVVGHAFSPSSHWQDEFDAAFEHELTPDQRTAIADITRDMESSTPMDRLLCGDVGYGKTEVAMRAAFKAVIDGKQVAFLAPTTILAFQHVRTLRERFAGFPIRIDLISRFRSKAEQSAVLKDLAAGQVDIIVGTHRLLSKDVVYRDLGLLVVDEEQRFGVAHKERIKQLRKRVDVLTMTATPIPRTLNMSLAGIRDMSVIETPPRDRLSIQTQVVRFESDIITRAIRTELERGGQVFFVHNRVESIYSVANLVTRLVPEARIVVAHGQMGEHDLERVMIDFVAHKHDVLVATTIVENGLDIANANTLVVNRADRYGLAQLYQLRGRVGRSDRRAYAYLLIPPEQSLSPVARRRLAAIREFSDLGSGFRIAALDLEIRGAGNLLGGEQSGHIEAVGFDMYAKLLEETIRELKGEELEDERRAAVNLRLNLRVEESYIPDMNQRLASYRRMASARSLEEVDALLAEFEDRYGEPPAGVRNLAQYARIRLLADRIGLDSIDRDQSVVLLKFRQDTKVDPTMLLNLVQSRGDLALQPPASLKLELNKPVEAPAGRTAAAFKAGTRLVSKQRDVPESVSWWTARATAAVAPGFTREEILAKPELDPAVPGGLFERLGQILDYLTGALVAS
jgi:transcription-repair coupling factor (superfamily II helicase)